MSSYRSMGCTRTSHTDSITYIDFTTFTQKLPSFTFGAGFKSLKCDWKSEKLLHQ